MAFEMATYASWTLCYNRRRNPPRVACSFAQVRTMCTRMQEMFPNCSFAPERIREGGVQMTHWPGKQDREYKTFRFASSDGYPWVDDATNDGHPFFLSRREQDYVTIKLKAFHGAPPFTDEELVAFRIAFEDAVPLQDGWRFYRTPRASTVNNRNHW